MSNTAVPTEIAAQREDSMFCLQFHDGKRRVTVRLLPGYARTLSDVTIGACNDPSKKPHIATIRCKLEISQ